MTIIRARVWTVIRQFLARFAPEAEFNSYGGDLGHFNSTWQEKVLGVPKDFFDPTDFIDSYQLQSAGRAFRTEAFGVPASSPMPFARDE